MATFFLSIWTDFTIYVKPSLFLPIIKNFLPFQTSFEWRLPLLMSLTRIVGAHDYPTSGVFEVEPRQCPGFKVRKSIFIGTTSLSPVQVREFMEQQSASYNGDTYHLIFKNCNRFCNDICYKLTGKSIPKWAPFATAFFLKHSEYLR